MTRILTGSWLIISKWVYLLQFRTLSVILKRRLVTNFVVACKSLVWLLQALNVILVNLFGTDLLAMESNTISIHIGILAWGIRPFWLGWSSFGCHDGVLLNQLKICWVFISPRSMSSVSFNWISEFFFGVNKNIWFSIHDWIILALLHWIQLSLLNFFLYCFILPEIAFALLRVFVRRLRVWVHFLVESEVEELTSFLLVIIRLVFAQGVF